MMEKYLLILLVFATPLVFAEPFNEEWKVMENIGGQWVEVENARITTDYTIYLGDVPYMKFEKSFTNTGSESGVFAFKQEMMEISSDVLEPEPETQFGSIALMILAVAVISIIAVTAKSRVGCFP